jgi:hydroxymethylglutaryl-CoA reductase (NADPH)
MRALVRPVAVRAASSPIEFITFFFVLATLAYFHVLDAVKHSSFFEKAAHPPLRPAYALFSQREHEWRPVKEAAWVGALAHPAETTAAVDVQQFTLPLDDKVRAYTHRQP